MVNRWGRRLRAFAYPTPARPRALPARPRALSRALSAPPRARAHPRPAPLRAFGRPTSGGWLVAVAGAWSALTVLLSVLLRPAHCVDGSGLSGFLATSLAQMRSVAHCPSGTLGYGPHTMAAVGAASALLASLVMAHLAAGLLAHWVARAARATRALLATLARPLPRLRGYRSTPAQATLTAWASTAVVRAFLNHPVWRRGPPLPA